MYRTRNLTFIMSAALAACGGTSTPNDNHAHHPDGGAAPAAKVNIEAEGAGRWKVALDASDEATWIPLDLDTMRAEDAAGAGWDLSASRFRVRVNGGVSGEGGVRVAALVGADLDALTEAPADGYATDAPQQVDPERPDQVPDSGADLVFERAHAASSSGWYTYDPATHVLGAADVVYVLLSTEGRAFALRFGGYYDAFGTPGHITLTVKEVAPPAAAPGPLEVDASSVAALALDGAPADLAAPLGWDLSLSRTVLATNGGASGAGLGGARWAPEGVDFEALTEAPTLGYAVDALLPLPGPPGSGEAPGNPVLAGWYDYDPVSHTVSPKAQPLLLRGAAGDYAKLQIISYQDGVYQLHLTPLPAQISRATLEVPLGDEWRYVSLRAGAAVTPDAPEDSPTWDLALRRDQVRTNGGASGAGGAAAQAAEATVTTAPEASYVEDAAEGHPDLTAWLAGERAPATFVVRAAGEGGYARLTMEAVDDATLRLTWTYSGPAGRALE